MQVGMNAARMITFGAGPNDAQLGKVVQTLRDTLEVVGPTNKSTYSMETVVKFNGKKYSIKLNGQQFTATRDDQGVTISYKINSRGIAPTKTFSYSDGSKNLSSRDHSVTTAVENLVKEIYQQVANGGSGSLDI